MTQKLDVTRCNKRFGKNTYDIRKVEDGVYEVAVSNPELREMIIPVDARAVDGNDNEVDISFSSDTPVLVYGEREILSHEEGDYDFSPLNNVGGILRNHDANQLVGAPSKPCWIETSGNLKKGRTRVRFGSTECARNCRTEVLIDKTMRGVSVGYRVKKWIFLENDSVFYRQYQGPGWVGIWSANEASFTPVPLDQTVGVNRSNRFLGDQGDVTMSDAEKAKQESEKLAQERADADAKKRADEEAKRVAEEAARSQPAPVKVQASEIQKELDKYHADCREIRSICKKAGLDERADEFIDQRKTPVEVRQICFELMTQKNAVGVEVTRDGRDSFRSAVSDGLILRAGVSRIEKPAAGADEFRGMTLLRIAEECLRRSGVRVPSDVRQLVELALRGAETITGSSSDFPFILANTANKSLLDGYATAPTSFQFWSSIGSLNDFKAASRIKFSEVGKLKLVQENGKYTETAMSEKRELIQLGTYARLWTMSRQGIINDDLDAFTRVLFSMGMQARFLPNDLAIAVLIANANLTDGNALFSSAHGNYSQETDRRLDTVAHAQAAAAYMYGLMAQQKSMAHAKETDGQRYLNLKPRIWLVAGTDELVARQAVVSASDAADNKNQGVTNPIAALGLVVVPDQNIKQSATDYRHFMFADPRLAPVVEVAFLQGNQSPYFERTDQTDTDGTKWLVRLDCGAAAVDHVGAVQETGTDG